MKGWAWVNLVLGAWLVVAPWVLGYGGGAAVINDVVLGLAVGVVAVILLSTLRVGWGWVHVALGAWLVLARWILGYRGAAATNDVILGLAVGIVSIILLLTPRTASEEAAVKVPPAAGKGMGEMTASAMRDMAAALARLSDAERKTMMGERLRMFAGMPDGERKRAMAAMMDGVAVLSDEDKKKLFKTRFEILAELTEAQRNNLMMAHMGILMEKGPQMMQQEMELTQAVMPQLSPTVRGMVKMMMDKMGAGRMG